MLRYALNRLFWTIPVVLVAITIAFFLVRATGGSPFRHGPLIGLTAGRLAEVRRRAAGEHPRQHAPPLRPRPAVVRAVRRTTSSASPRSASAPRCRSGTGRSRTSSGRRGRSRSSSAGSRSRCARRRHPRRGRHGRARSRNAIRAARADRLVARPLDPRLLRRHAPHLRLRGAHALVPTSGWDGWRAKLHADPHARDRPDRLLHEADAGRRPRRAPARVRPDGPGERSPPPAGRHRPRAAQRARAGAERSRADPRRDDHDDLRRRVRLRHSRPGPATTSRRRPPTTIRSCSG